MVVESYSTKLPPVEVRHALPPTSLAVRRPELDLVAGLLVVALLALGVWCSYWAKLRGDQYQLILLGQTVYDGGRLYVDVWENKPPGIAWINALGFVLSGGKQIAVWVLPGVVALACVFTLWIAVAKAFNPTTGRWTALLASVLASLRLYDASSINPDFYSAVLELAACSIWLLAVTATRGWGAAGLALFAGLAWAAATCVKQTGATGLFVLTVVTIVAVLTPFADRRRWLAAMVLTWLGFLIGAAAVVGVLYKQGTHGQAWDAVFTFNRGLFSGESMRQIWSAWPRGRTDLVVLVLPLWIAAFGAVVTLFVGRSKGANGAFVVAMVLWWIAASSLALLGPSMTMRYWQGTFPPLILLAAAGLFHLEEMYRRLEPGYRGALIVLSATAVVLLGRPLYQSYRLGVAESYVAYTDQPHERMRLEELGRAVQDLVPAGERTYVWGYRPGVYVSSDRRPASRFTYPRSAEQMREILADLSAGKAYAILVPQDGSPEFDRFCDEDCHWKRAQILADYVPEKVVDGLEIRVRRQEALTTSQ